MNDFIDSGSLDRRVTILSRADITDATYGTREPTWSEIATVWAQVLEIAPSRADRLANEVSLMQRPATIRMRWRGDVTQANRIRIDGVEMRIVGGPAMIGRRVGLEIMVEALSTEGQQP